MVEQLTLNQRVRSSSLRRPTILFNSCLVTAQTHGYFFRDSGTDHVSDCASGASMHQEAAIKFLDGSAFAYLLEFPKPPQLRRHCATPCENRRSALRCMKTKAQFGLLDSRNPLLPPPSANHKTRTRIKNALLLGSSAGPIRTSAARSYFSRRFRASARRVSEEEMANDLPIEDGSSAVHSRAGK